MNTSISSCISHLLVATMATAPTESKNTTSNTSEKKNQYIARCIKYAQEKLPEIIFAPTGSFEQLKTIIIQVHRHHNDTLLASYSFPGCGIAHCVWKHGAKTCSCGRFHDFHFSTNDIDWLKDTSLDKHQPVGKFVPFFHSRLSYGPV